MKLGIISDIHGNIEALETVVEFLRGKGVTDFACCGDIVGYGPDPNRCIEAVREMNCICVAGNHDYATVGETSIDGFNRAAKQAVLWTRAQLTEPNRRFLENLPITAEDAGLFIVHSSPSAPEDWEYVLTVPDADDEMDHYPGGVCVVGHSHQPFAVERLPGKMPRQFRDDVFDIRPDGKYFINAGSVGQPRDGDPRACCLLFDDGNQVMTRYRVPYDILAVETRIRAAGLPEYLASRLELGR